MRKVTSRGIDAVHVLLAMTVAVGCGAACGGSTTSEPTGDDSGMDGSASSDDASAPDGTSPADSGHDAADGSAPQPDASASDAGATGDADATTVENDASDGGPASDSGGSDGSRNVDTSDAGQSADASEDGSADSGQAEGGAAADASEAGPSSEGGVDASADAGSMPPVVASCGAGGSSLLSGLVGWWHGENDFHDELGADDGTNAGAAGFAAGVTGSAFHFTGAASSYVSVANGSDLATIPTAGALTIEAWINPAANGGRIVDKITAGGTNGYLLDTYGGHLRMIVANKSVSSAATLATGTWTHVAGVYDGANVTVYIDGVSAGSTAFTGAIPTNTLPLQLGADSTGGSRFDGAVDEARIYSRALSAADVLALYDESVCQ